MDIYELMHQFEYGLVVVESSTNIVKHICVYEETPQLADYLELVKELSEDTEFGLTDANFDDLSFHVASGDTLKKIIEDY